MEEQRSKENKVQEDNEELNENEESLDTESEEEIEEELSDEQTEHDVNSDVQELQQELEQLKQEKEETYDRFLRLQAEFDNFKKRTQREKVAERKYKSQDLVTELLPALDNFERALQVEVTEENKSIIEGITMVYNQLKEALKTEGVEEIETVGKEFDPNIHHAVMQVEEDDKESNVVVEELQKGYMLKDRVIRPAMVKVNK